MGGSNPLDYNGSFRASPTSVRCLPLSNRLSAFLTHSPGIQGSSTQWILTTDTATLNIVKNPLPSGSYRIRTYNGQHLLTMSDDARGYITRHLKGNDIERQTVALYLSIMMQELILNSQWSVTRDEGPTAGLYTIQNANTGGFLASGSGAETDGAFVIGQANTPYSWVIQSLDNGVMFLYVPSSGRVLEFE